MSSNNAPQLSVIGLNLAVLNLVANPTVQIHQQPTMPNINKPRSPVKKLRRHVPERNNNFGYMRMKRCNKK